MSYIERASDIDRIPVHLVDLHMPSCGLRFGVGACTATGEPCHNAYATCALKSAYAPTTTVYKLCEKINIDVPLALGDSIPVIDDITLSPVVITPGKGLGQRGRVSIRCIDVPWPDHLHDPYYAQRSYASVGDTDTLGTFWGRFTARYKYHIGARIDILSGFADGDGVLNLADMQTRTYIIESISGAGGTVTIVAKDVLKLADDERAQCPAPSNMRLNANITAADTVINVEYVGNSTTYSLASEFTATPFWVRVASEVMQVTAVNITGNSAALTVDRGQYYTKAADAKALSAVQLCCYFAPQSVDKILYTLLTQYAKIGNEFINNTAWDLQGTQNIAGKFTALITEPVGVNKLIAELTEQANAYIWWDDVARLIQLRPVSATPVDMPVFNDSDHIISPRSSLKDNERLSRVVVHFDPIDPTKKLDETSNYAQHYTYVDLESEGDRQYKSSKARTIYSRWIRQGGLGRVDSMSKIIIDRYRDPPRELGFEVDVSNQVATGDYIQVNTRTLQAPSGAVANVTMQVTEVTPLYRAARLRIVAQEFAFTTEAPSYVITLASDFNVNLRTVFLQSFDDSQILDNTVVIDIPASTVIGSVSVAQPALRTGSGWPAGTTLLVNAAGKVIGKGGDGGDGLYNNSSYLVLNGTGQNGKDGGLGFAFDDAGVSVVVNVAADAFITGGGGGGSVSVSMDTGSIGPLTRFVGGGGGAGASELIVGGVTRYGGGEGGLTRYSIDNVTTGQAQNGSTDAGGAGDSGADGKGNGMVSGGAGGAPGMPGSAGVIDKHGGGNGGWTYIIDNSGRQAGAALNGTAASITINNQGLIRGHGGAINATQVVVNGNALVNT